MRPVRAGAAARAAAVAALGVLGCAEFRAERPDGIGGAISDARTGLTIVALRRLDGVDPQRVAAGLRARGFAYVAATPRDLQEIEGRADVVVDLRSETETEIYSTIYGDSRSAGYWVGFPFLYPFELLYFPIDRYSRIRTWSVRIEPARGEPRDVRFRALEFGMNYYHPVGALRRAADPRLDRLLLDRLAYEIARSP